MARERTAAASRGLAAGLNAVERGALDAAERGAALSIGLSAVIVAASVQEPRVLTVRGGLDDDDVVEALPSGPLEAEHRTLEIGLRRWAERQPSQRPGPVEQLYTFGDPAPGAGGRGAAL